MSVSERRERVKHLLINTNMPLKKIIKEVRCDYSLVSLVLDELGDEFRLHRAFANKSKSKFKGGTHVGQGYRWVPYPDWFTGAGKNDKRYAQEHILVLLEHIGLTELPVDTCVHHVDEDKLNNDITNLVLMDSSEHIRFHKQKE